MGDATMTRRTALRGAAAAMTPIMFSSFSCCKSQPEGVGPGDGKLTIDNLIRTLHDFTAKTPDIKLTVEGIAGVYSILGRNGRAEIEVVKASADVSVPRDVEELTKTGIESRGENIPVSIVNLTNEKTATPAAAVEFATEAHRVPAQVYCGDVAKVANQGRGTVGWNVLLETTPGSGVFLPACLTASHVAVPATHTPATVAMTLGGGDGAIKEFVFLKPAPTVNYFDIASVFYDSATTTGVPHTRCNGVYPVDLSPTLYPGEKVTKAGVASGCTHGTFSGVGNAAVPCGNTNVLFECVLRFNKFSSEGDSGALVCRDADNTAVGLIIGNQGSDITVASMMFRLKNNPWRIWGVDPATGLPKITAPLGGLVRPC